MSDTLTERSPDRLDLLLASAKTYEPSDRDADGVVASVQRSAVLLRHNQRRERTKRWSFALVSGVLSAAVIFLVMRDSTSTQQHSKASYAASPAPAPIQLGERVALTASLGGEYRIVAATPTRTEIIVQRGSVTTRLFHGTTEAHELLVRAADLEVRATGTIFTVGVDENGQPYARVHEGRIATRSAKEKLELSAGQSFPASLRADPFASSAALKLGDFQISMATSRAGASTKEAQEDTAVDTDGEQEGPASPATRAAINSSSEKPIQRWREARALRSTGQSGQAIVKLEQLAKMADPTWAPLARLELARIYDSERSQPDKALGHAQIFLKSFPSHALASEARRLACQQLAQLGRSDEALCPAAP